MLTYMAKRVVASIAVMFAVLILVFIATRLIGDPTSHLLPLDVGEAEREALRERLGLNDPFLEQLGRFMSNAVHLDFGNSLYYSEPALDVALDRMPASLLLLAATLGVAAPIAVASGVLASIRQGTWIDRGIRTTSLIALAIVDFAFALLLILVFSVQLGWFPTSGYGGLSFLVLPVMTLAVRPFGRIAQLSRGAVAEEMRKPYMTTAQAKGLGEHRRVTVHAVRNAGIPIVSVIGLEAIGLVNGAIIVETIFAWPGIGALLIDAISQRDLPLIEAIVVVTGVAVVVINLIVDLTFGLLNPKITYQAA